MLKQIRKLELLVILKLHRFNKYFNGQKVPTIFKSSGKKAPPTIQKQQSNETYTMMSRSETRSSNVLQPKQPQEIIYSQPKTSISNKTNLNNNVSTFLSYLFYNC